MTYGFIGTGNMGGAIAKAVANSKGGKDIYLANRTMAKAEALAKEIGAQTSTNEKVAESCGMIFIGVKPKLVEGVLQSLKPILDKRTDSFVLVSMAAGVSVADVENAAGKNPVIRIMPNTACEVGESMTLYCKNELVTEAMMADFFDAMKLSGLFDELDENLLDAGSAVSGCGGAFVCLFMEALADGGVKCGLPRAKALKYAGQMVLGTAKLMLETNQHPAVMKDAICSPGGSTIEGVHALENGGLRGSVIDAVIASCEKNKRLK